MTKFTISRRRFLDRATVGGSGLLAVGLQRARRAGDRTAASAISRRRQQPDLPGAADARRPRRAGAGIHRGRHPPAARPNGVTAPDDETYKALLSATISPTGGWRWRAGRKAAVAVARPAAGDAARTQITRHDCVEGWSCIAKWTGVPLSLRARRGEGEAGGALRRLPLHGHDRARPLGRHQILRLDRPDRRPPPADDPGLRHERQAPAGRERRAAARAGRAAARLQDAEIPHRIELVDSFAAIGVGKGGYWEDSGYDWFGGI